MKKFRAYAFEFFKTILGCAIFAFGFSVFLEPGGFSAGGISGLSMLVVHVTKFGSVGLISTLINLPLFAIAGIKIGKKFFFGSLLGMACSSVFIDLFAMLPIPDVAPLLGAIYGSVIAGLGLGIVFANGVSTGGSDIIVRLLNRKYRHLPIGVISIGFDMVVLVLTGIVYKDLNRALYSGVAVFLCGQVVDAVVYRFDYSKVAMIITEKYEEAAKLISDKLERGATYLDAEGTYSRKPTKVVLAAVKRQQIAQLKEMISELDPNAFIIVQEAHQVLGDGFAKYTKDSL